jgi:hypothetical protein
MRGECHPVGGKQAARLCGRQAVGPRRERLSDGAARSGEIRREVVGA